MIDLFPSVSAYPVDRYYMREERTMLTVKKVKGTSNQWDVYNKGQYVGRVTAETEHQALEVARQKYDLSSIDLDALEALVDERLLQLENALMLLDLDLS